MEASPVQPLKASAPMARSFPGRVMLARLVQPENAPLPMLVRVVPVVGEPKVTDFRLMKP